MDRQKPPGSTNDPSILGQHAVELHGMKLTASPLGGQVLSWIAEDRERLFCAPSARARPNAAIRGGVPVIFPQFATWGTGSRHGFARRLPWRQVANPDASHLCYVLEDDTQTRADWPHAFRLVLQAALSPGCLSLSLEATNTGTDRFDFTAALHSYLALDDIARTRISGLAGRTFHDATTGRLQTDHASLLELDGSEVDRIYRDVDAGLVLEDGPHRLDIGMTGFRDAVVWNPGPEKASRLEDLGPGDGRRFICIEAARVLVPVHLAPGQAWRGTQVFSLPRYAAPTPPPVPAAANRVR